MPRVEVVYATPDLQLRRSVELAEGATVRAAIEASGLLALCPGIRLERGGVAIYGQRAELDAVVEDGDRVELLRPLRADPKAVRRRRAAAPRGR